MLATLKTVRKALGKGDNASSSSDSSAAPETGGQDALTDKYGPQIVNLATTAAAGLGEKVAAQMAAQLLLSLEGFHGNGIILRDVKEDNVMLSAKG